MPRPRSTLPRGDETDSGAESGGTGPNDWLGPSRSQKKRDARAVGDLGERLAALSPASLARLPIDEELREALSVTRDMQRGARARQLRRIGKLLRSRDHDAIAEALAGVGQPSGAEIIRDREVGAWRERLLGSGDDELGALLTDHPGADRQLLRQLVRQARSQPLDAKVRRARRDLFRELRALLEAEVED